MKKIIIPTLCFHSVRHERHGDAFAVTPNKFSEIIEFISDKFGTWDMNDIDESIVKNNFAPNNKVLVTFDDGYKDNYQIVLPILKKYHVKAVFFLLPTCLGKNNLWNTRSEVVINHMNLREAKLIADEGHSIGSHGMTHHRLTKFSDKIVTKELVESKKILERMINVNIDCYAYPYGATDARIAKLAKKIYKYSFGVDNSPVDWTKSNFAEIRREFVWPTNTIEQINELVTNFGIYNNNPNNIVVSS